MAAHESRGGGVEGRGLGLSSGAYLLDVARVDRGIEVSPTREDDGLFILIWAKISSNVLQKKLSCGFLLSSDSLTLYMHMLSCL